MAGLLNAGSDAVVAELRRWARTPFVWARDNCGLSVLAYAEHVRERRVVPPPRFDSEIGAGLMLERAGGFHAYCAWAMAQIGCPPTDAPDRGDVGLIDLPNGLTAAICLGGGMWAARGDHAAVIQRAAPIAAWRVPCPRR